MPGSSKGREIQVLALTATAIVAFAVNFAVKCRKPNLKALAGSKVMVNLSASAIRELADRIIAESKAAHDALASVPISEIDYKDIMILAELEAFHYPLVQSCIFPRLVSLSDEVRQASSEAEQRLNVHIASCRRREDVYRVVKSFASQGKWPNAEARCYVKALVREFEQNGLHLCSTEKEEVQRLQGLIDCLSMEYVQNLHDDCTFLLFTEEELDGLPMEFLQILDRESYDKFKIPLKSSYVSLMLEQCKVRLQFFKFKIPLKSSYVSLVLEQCKVGATRRKVAVAWGILCKEVNQPLLENLVCLRSKLARLLGFKHHSDYAVRFRMAKTPTEVVKFLDDLFESLSEVAAKERATLNELKKKEEGDTAFEIHDLFYYEKKFRKEKLNIDFGAIMEYFPLSVVLQGIFKVLLDLLGLRFKEIVDSEVWHEDVRVFSVFDLNSDELIGYTYLDLYSREGKYGKTCVLPLQNGSLLPNGARQVPVVLLISEFSKQDDKLLQFAEVVNLFHQFGHVAHHLCNLSSFVRFSGLSFDADFVEIIGQIFENLCYESSILKLISGHYQDTRRPLKTDVCVSLKRWRHSISADKLRQEIFFCLGDLAVHLVDNIDSLKPMKYFQRKMMSQLPMFESTSPASCFPNPAIGYEATCYSRIWSKVFATDVFVSKFHDVLNQRIGLQFRNEVLAPGATVDPFVCLSNFIGRQPSSQAFVNSIRQYLMELILE